VKANIYSLFIDPKSKQSVFDIPYYTDTPIVSNWEARVLSRNIKPSIMRYAWTLDIIRKNHLENMQHVLRVEVTDDVGNNVIMVIDELVKDPE